MRGAVINSYGVVINVIVLGGAYQAPDGCTVVAIPAEAEGFVAPWAARCDNGVFSALPPRPGEWYQQQPNGTWVAIDPAIVDAVKTAAATRDLDDSKVMRTLFETLFQIVTDVRALQTAAGQNKPPINRAQLRDQMIAFYKTL